MYFHEILSIQDIWGILLFNCIWLTWKWLFQESQMLLGQDWWLYMLEWVLLEFQLHNFSLMKMLHLKESKISEWVVDYMFSRRIIKKAINQTVIKSLLLMPMNQSSNDTSSSHNNGMKTKIMGLRPIGYECKLPIKKSLFLYLSQFFCMVTVNWKSLSFVFVFIIQ